MIAYSIAVHPLSAAILQTDYEQDGKIVIPLFDPASDLLTSNRTNRKGITRIVTIYTTQKSVSPYSGYALYLYHKRQCFQYCETSYEHGVSVKKAMETWFAYYDIDKEYDIDTMYREWLRYKKIRTPKVKKEKVHVSFDHHYANTEKIVSYTVAKFVELFYTKNDRFNYSLLRQLRMHAYWTVQGNLPKLKGVSKSNAYYQYHGWENFMKQYPECKRYYEMCLQSSKL